MTTSAPAPILPEAYFTPMVLLGVIESLAQPTTLFLDNCFPDLLEFETEKVAIDLEINAIRVAAFCAPEVEGRIVAEHGYRTNEFEPGYIKEKTMFTPRGAFRRRMGERIGMSGGGMSAMQRQMARVADSLSEKIAAIVNRKELMASQILATGKTIVEGAGIARTEVDFERDPALTIALAGDACWDHPDAQPLGDIEDWCNLVLMRKGGQISTVVMGVRAWKAAWENEKFRQAFHTGPNFNVGNVTIGFNTTMQLSAYKGRIGNVDIWTYQGYYDDPVTGLQVPYLAEDGIVGFGSYLMGRQLHGAIMDEEAGMMPLAYFPKSWLSKDPAGRILMVQSAPLVAPFRPNNSFGVTTVLSV